MWCWIIDDNNLPVLVQVEQRGAETYYVPKMKKTVRRAEIYVTMEEAAKAHLGTLKQAMIENDLKIEKLIGKKPTPSVAPPPVMSNALEQLVRQEMTRSNDHLFKKTKIPYLWIVK